MGPPQSSEVSWPSFTPFVQSSAVGLFEGDADGLAVGLADGEDDGEVLGEADGEVLGEVEGETDGASVEHWPSIGP